MINNSDFSILIIDNAEEFNKELSVRLKQYKFHVHQAFNELDALSCMKINENKIDLVVLNVDFDDVTATKIFEYITENTQAKIILLSSEDLGIKREEYFSKGILDYHLTYKNIDHIVDDISDTIHSLATNDKETILIIDSSPYECTKMSTILQARNYNVLTTTKASEGLELLKNNEISLLILDMEISDIDALDLLEGLRDMYLLNEFFVFVISDNNNPSVVRDALKGGAKDFIKKPFLYEEFLLKTDILVTSSKTRKTTSKQKRQIENSLKSFKELLDSSIGAMFIFEKNLCVNCNNEAIKLLGYTSKKSVLNQNIFDIFTDISDEHKAELLDERVDYHFEDNIISKDSKVYQVQIKERNIFIDRKILKIIAVMDVTDVKRHEKILSQQTKMASMGEMIGNIAHQWRQPLTAISIAAGGIKLSYELDMEDKEDTIVELDNIVENTKFLSSTIESFQNFLKVDKVTKEFDLQETFQKTLAIIHANLKANSISVVENYPHNYKIQGIQNELVQVFLNIINNSADVLKTKKELKDERFIFLEINKDEKDIVVSIQDNAHGIPTSIINKIFEPYFTTKHKSQGTGLGLYMTHQIIDKMGGKISVENNEFYYKHQKYIGAKFMVRFPLNI